MLQPNPLLHSYYSENTTIYTGEILAAIKSGEMARNHFDNRLVDLKFGDSHNQIEGMS